MSMIQNVVQHFLTKDLSVSPPHLDKDAAGGHTNSEGSLGHSLHTTLPRYDHLPSSPRPSCSFLHHSIETAIPHPPRRQSRYYAFEFLPAFLPVPAPRRIERVYPSFPCTFQVARNPISLRGR
jgi:hypothetical protein